MFHKLAIAHGGSELPGYCFRVLLGGFPVHHENLTHPASVKGKLLRVASASLAVALVAHVSLPSAEAQSKRSTAASLEEAEGPLLLQVSINDQRIYVYDRNGMVTHTKISSGRKGHETPVGIYSILEKKVDHTSNIYLDAKMPHMQRLTQTGIALHGGVIPGYPASGGCVRMPFGFARQIFQHTDINGRVVIAPDVRAPISFTHASLFSQLPSATRSGTQSGALKQNSTRADIADELLGIRAARAATEPSGRTLESAAEARVAEREGLVAAIERAGARAERATEAEKAARKAISEANARHKKARSANWTASQAAKKARGVLAYRERQLKRAEARIPKNTSKVRADRLAALQEKVSEEEARVAEGARAVEEANAAAEEASAELEAAKAAIAEAKDARTTARADIKDANEAQKEAKKAVADFDRIAKNRKLPVSVFISRASGKIRIRQGFQPVLEADVKIEDPDVPLNTFVFTAIDWKDDSQTDLEWMAVEVSELSDATSKEIKARRRAKDISFPEATDEARAARALDRITIPREAAELIAEVVKPGSALILSDYDKAHSETRYRGTDFIVQMPEVVAKITKPTPRPRREEVVRDSGGWFWFGAPPPPRDRRRRRPGPRHH